MKKWIAGFVFIGSILAVMPILPASAANEMAIRNLKFGLVCGSRENRHICHQGGDIAITNESICIYNKHPEQCTWYGYSFDYTAISNDITLDCRWSSDTPVALGNPHEELAKKASSMAFQLPLSKSTTHFFNPLYATATGVGGHQPAKHETQSCSYQGKRLFQVSFTLHYPDP